MKTPGAVGTTWTAPAAMRESFWKTSTTARPAGSSCGTWQLIWKTPAGRLEAAPTPAKKSGAAMPLNFAVMPERVVETLGGLESGIKRVVL